LAEQNLILYSQEIDNAAWSKVNSTATGNSTAAPDGTTTADTLTPNATNGFHYCHIDGTAISNTGPVQTHSVYVKANGYTKVGLREGAVSGASATFNLTTVAVISQNSTASTVSNSAITSVGNGWYRISTTYTGSGLSRIEVWILPDSYTTGDVTSFSWAGNGTSGMFIWGAQVAARSILTAYTATTTSVVSTYVPVLLTAGGGQPRFDHNPTTSESLGLLFELQKTNQITYSTDFSLQSVTNANVYNNAIIAPDGTLTGAMIQDNSTNGQHGIIRTYAVTSGQNNTTTVYLKYGTQRYVSLVYPSATSTRLWATFDLLNGTITGSWANVATITAVGNGWYRCSVVEAAGATGSAYLELQFNSTGVNPSWPTTTQPAAYAGIGSYFYAWGMQGEAGAFPSSYIPTTSAAATRASDVATMSGSNFSSWYNNSEGTFYTEVSFALAPYNVSNTYHFECSDGTSNNRLIGFTGGSVASLFVTPYGQTGAVSIYTAAAPSVNISYRCGFLIETNNFAVTASAVVPQTDNSGLMPAVDRMNIGSNYSSTEQLNGWLKKLSYYPQAVTSAQLQALTS
jgi:hypothetical protein